MRYRSVDIVFQEVPGEISLAWSITGCQLRCQGCHSPELWTEGNGSELTKEAFDEMLNRYSGYATCVLFFGGEWHEDALAGLLSHAKTRGFKTCLYTGEDDISRKVKSHLDYLKTGRWIATLGGLASRKTNQRFVAIPSGKNLNHLFWKE